MGDLFLGIDVGTSGAKALVIDAGGAVIAAHTEAYELLSPQSGEPRRAPKGETCTPLGGRGKGSEWELEWQWVKLGLVCMYVSMRRYTNVCMHT